MDSKAVFSREVASLVRFALRADAAAGAALFLRTLDQNA